jgi:hypothetical protein
MRIANETRQPLVINVGNDAEGKPKDIHLRARGFKGYVSGDLSQGELDSPEVQRLLARGKVRLLG